ncbi:DUF3631 domain-containing protein [Bradyrhizobium sp. Leo170]|uniref:DUF3631 domain-containing protein n=1 Tax=Bradyrhizobium sp. Leo170 TaxID=1571199 RepID=UPI0013EE9329|nr:DUF3631 domain-containing protein [Bradyrhizobium sp. Leo170]
MSDRSILIELRRRRPNDTNEAIESFRLDRVGHLDVLARKAARWAQDHAVEVGAADPELPKRLGNRQRDNWRTLKMVATVIGGPWPGRIDAAATAAQENGGDEASQLEQLLEDIRDVFADPELFREPDNRHNTIRSADLVQRLVALESRPWGEMGRNKKPLTANKLARLLKPLGIIPERIGPETDRARGYVLWQFEDAFTRYLSPSEPHIRPECDEMGTSRIFEPSSPDDGWTDEKFKKANNDGPPDGWTAAKGGNSEGTPFEPGPEAGNGGAWPGLSQRAIDQFTFEISDWAELQDEVPEDLLRREIGRRLAGNGIPANALKTESDRVLRSLFETWTREDRP